MRLYALYDPLLNTKNKNHYGVVQELNTSQIMVNYHNLSSTFTLTDKMGVTSGQSSAEQQWNLRATADLNYYNYALHKTNVRIVCSILLYSHSMTLVSDIIMAVISQRWSCSYQITKLIG